MALNILNLVNKIMNPGSGHGTRIAARDPWAIYGNPAPPANSTPGAGTLGDEGEVWEVSTNANEIAAILDITGVAVATTTPLGTTTYTSKAVYTNGFARVVGTVFSDSSGTLHIKQSSDGSHWDSDSTVAVTGGTGAGFSIEVTAPYVQIVYVPTSSQAVFRLYPFLRRI